MALTPVPAAPLSPQPAGGMVQIPLPRLREIFEFCDLDGDGHVSRIQLIRGLRREPGVAACFGLPPVIQQADDIWEEFERFYKDIDRSSVHKVSLIDFLDFAAAGGFRTPLGTNVLMQGYEATHGRMARRCPSIVATKRNPVLDPCRPGQSAAMHAAAPKKPRQSLWKVARDKLGLRVQAPIGPGPHRLQNHEIWSSAKNRRRHTH